MINVPLITKAITENEKCFINYFSPKAELLKDLVIIILDVACSVSYIRIRVIHNGNRYSKSITYDQYNEWLTKLNLDKARRIS